jgi:hypothetical protein
MDERVPNARPPLPVVVENPVQRRANILGTVMASLGMTAVVILVLYGLTRPEAPQQTASAPSQTTQSAPAGDSSGQNPQASTPEPSTTGQGQGQGQDQGQGGGPDKQQPNTGAKPGDQPKPQQ